MTRGFESHPLRHKNCAIIFVMAIQLSDVTNLLGFTNTRASDPIRPSGPASNPETREDKKVLLSWETVTRTHYSIKGNPKMNRTLLIIGAVIALLLVAMGEFLMIAVIASIIFLRYILSASPARAVHHTITTHGIDYSGQFYDWTELKSFHFVNTDGTDVLCVDTIDRLPGRLFLLLNPGDMEKVKESVGRYLTFLPEAPKTFADKVYEAAADKISVNN